MKIVTKEYEVFEFNELKPDIQVKVIEKWYENEEYYFLEDDLTEFCKELFEKNNIKIIDKFKLEYSLSSSQGDGACFMGKFEWGENQYVISKVSHHYSHSYTTEIIELSRDEDGFYENEAILNSRGDDDFVRKYHSICKEIEKYGYGILEYKMSPDEFSDLCKSNDYQFLIDGKILTA